MTKRSQSVKGLLVLSTVLISSATLSSEGGKELGSPLTGAINSHHVNLGSKTLAYGINDLSIGYGDGALTHSIEIGSNDAMNFSAQVRGPKDKYQGGIRRIISTTDNGSPRKEFKVISVWDHVDTYYFTVENGDFKGLKNQLNTLSVETVQGVNTFLLTKEDGTEVRYGVESPIPADGYFDQDDYVSGYMREIKRPDGFTITIHLKKNQNGDSFLGEPIRSVNTSNGLQLKYVYEVNTAGLDADKANSPQNDVNEGWQVDPNNWWPYHPVKIIALNNAVEICDIEALSCSPTHDWPEVNYSWENGMPRAFVIDESDFTITDALGRQTIFHHKSFNMGTVYGGEPGDAGEVEWSEHLTDNYVPRIVKITEANGRTIDYKYMTTLTITSNCDAGASASFAAQLSGPMVTQEYDDVTGDTHITTGRKSAPPVSGVGFCGNTTMPKNFGALMSSTENGHVVTYNEVFPHGNAQSMEMESVANDYQGTTTIVSAFTNYGNGKIAMGPYEIETPMQKVVLTKDFQSKVKTVKNKLTNITSVYTYDTKGRITNISDGGISRTVTFDSPNCTTKSCNRPYLISNRYSTAPGNYETPLWTTFTYKHASGQVNVIQEPAINNVVPKTRFYYADKKARFFDPEDENGALKDASQVSVLTKKIKCLDSALNGSTCAGGDKITTTYHYPTGSAPHNLLLLGHTVSAQGETESYTTCYKYDKYGNQIGVTEPKSGVTDCNIGREY